ncbi:hypothetical protein ACFFRR_001375 [Megaselia abdita]
MISSLISGGCNSYATKLKTKTADSSERLFYKSATIPAWSKGILITLVVLTMLEGLTLHVATALPARIRKRYVNEHKPVDEILAQVNVNYAWENPCGGSYEFNPTLHYSKKIKTKVLRNFRNKLNTTYKNIQNTFINMKNLEVNSADWTNKTGEINDLPIINKTARPKVQMKKWYADLEVFTFIIGEMSRKEDATKNKHPHDRASYSPALRKLFKLSRSMLCDLQHTINDTIRQENKRPFPTNTTLEAMQKRLPRLIKDIEDRERLHTFHFEYIFKSYTNYLKRMKRGVAAWIKKVALKKELQNNSSSTSSMNLSDVSISQSASRSDSSSRGWSSTESKSESMSMIPRLRHKQKKH